MRQRWPKEHENSKKENKQRLPYGIEPDNPPRTENPKMGGCTTAATCNMVAEESRPTENLILLKEIENVTEMHRTKILRTSQSLSQDAEEIWRRMCSLKLPSEAMKDLKDVLQRVIWHEIDAKEMQEMLDDHVSRSKKICHQRRESGPPSRESLDQQ